MLLHVFGKKIFVHIYEYNWSSTYKPIESHNFKELHGLITELILEAKLTEISLTDNEVNLFLLFYEY